MDETSSKRASEGLGAIMRRARTDAGLTLQALSERVGCAKSYLSAIETGARTAPPGDALLTRIEDALGLAKGCLLSAADWQRTPAPVRREVSRLEADRRDARRLAAILGHGAGQDRASLDEAYRSGELKRLVERLAPTEGAIERTHLPMDIPLINNVAAGYPSDFTDLGFPARIAQDYIRSPDLDDPDAFAARVVGNSMLPDYREGDIVIFSPARDVRAGMDCFARIEPDHETTFKRVYFERDHEGREMIRLQPLNNAYPPRTLPREDVAGLYPAVTVTRSIT